MSSPEIPRNQSRALGNLHAAVFRKQNRPSSGAELVSPEKRVQAAADSVVAEMPQESREIAEAILAAARRLGLA